MTDVRKIYTVNDVNAMKPDEQGVIKGYITMATNTPRRMKVITREGGEVWVTLNRVLNRSFNKNHLYEIPVIRTKTGVTADPGEIIHLIITNPIAAGYSTKTTLPLITTIDDTTTLADGQKAYVQGRILLTKIGSRRIDIMGSASGTIPIMIRDEEGINRFIDRSNILEIIVTMTSEGLVTTNADISVIHDQIDPDADEGVVRTLGDWEALRVNDTAMIEAMVTHVAAGDGPIAGVTLKLIDDVIIPLTVIGPQEDPPVFVINRKGTFSITKVTPTHAQYNSIKTVDSVAVKVGTSYFNGVGKVVTIVSEIIPASPLYDLGYRFRSDGEDVYTQMGILDIDMPDSKLNLVEEIKPKTRFIIWRINLSEHSVGTHIYAKVSKPGSVDVATVFEVLAWSELGESVRLQAIHGLEQFADSSVEDYRYGYWFSLDQVNVYSIVPQHEEKDAVIPSNPENITIDTKNLDGFTDEVSDTLVKQKAAEQSKKMIRFMEMVIELKALGDELDLDVDVTM